MSKILFIVPLPPPLTGMAVASKLIYDEIDKTHDVKLINYSKGNFKQGLNSSFSRVIEILKMIISVFRARKKVDVVYFTITQSIAGNIRDLILLYVLRKKKIIIHLHGGGIKATVFNRFKFLKFVNVRMLRYVDTIIVLSDSLKDCYAGMGVGNKIRVVPNSADDSIFLTDCDIKKKYEQNKIKILFLSNLIYGKGHIELVKAVKMLPSKIKSKIEVQFVGGFESDEKQQEFLESIKSENTIKYLGIKKGDERIDFFSEAQVFCLPTYYPYEGQPISILEAYASGCCVVTTSHNGIVDIFKSGENGFVVEKKSVKSLSQTLALISQINTDDLYNIGCFNNSQARQFYTNKQYLDNMKKVLLNG